jgi:hypothetical protein
MPYEKNVDFTETRTSTLLDQTTFVSPAGFRLVIDSLKYPNAQFNIQTASIPEIAVDATTFQTPQRTIEIPGDKVRYENFETTFLVDEDLVNYTEIHDWILGMAIEPDTPNINKTRDMSLLVLNSHNNISREIKFIDAYPTSLSTLDFDAKVTDIEYLVASVSFNYSYFKVQ